MPGLRSGHFLFASVPQEPSLRIRGDADACLVFVKDTPVPRRRARGPQERPRAVHLRNFMGTLRGTGVDTGSPRTFSAADARSCTNRLDGLLRRNTKPWTDKA